MVVILCFGSRRRGTLHVKTLFVQSDVKRPLLSVGKLTQSGAEVKFGDKNSWIDRQADSGVQRGLVRVKEKTFGLSIHKTAAWIIHQTSDPAPHAVVAPVDEESRLHDLIRIGHEFLGNIFLHFFFNWVAR